ncbi:putative bifunctional diguanylate cyclase/phosphodiesterase [Undibacterium pigrum]|uniref:Diguanylate cyclase (GGDEF)-like protein n=1 Tax=Undibacterium pigrum TaxID=401470 RepID=A0A318J9I2_9BURK|nr:EAL domain-containing protein [Undibacterium pigrum]PXX43230.1 diguanylate cyclase (GGDEF)-like protein [Undibacterium pigrum]
MPDSLDRLTKFLRLRRIGVRLAISYGLLLILFSIVLLLPISQIRNMTARNDKFVRKEVQSLLYVQELSISTENVGRALLQFLTVPYEQRVPEYTIVDEKNRQIDRLIASLEALLSDDEQLKSLKLLKEKRSVYNKYYLDTVNQLEEEGQEAAKASFIKQVKPALDALLDQSKSFLKREQELILAQQAQAQQELERTGMLVAILSVLGVIMAAILAWLTTRSVVKPLARLEASARQIARGDYQTRFIPSKTEEVARVGEALNTMAEAIGIREQTVERLAYYDSLTGLPNRTLLLKTHEGQGLPHQGFILMDLARLKVINETLGFDTGDTVISDIALRLRKVIDNGSNTGKPWLARLAGGAFAILCADSSKASIEDLHQRIDAAMAAPVKCGSHSVDVSLVYGFAITAGTPLPLMTLARNAEVALYAAKRSANASAWYTDAQEASRLTHLSLLSDLRSAVRESELQMWLQPKLSLTTGKAYGFEALVRWQHPVRGFISPAEFVPFAERTGYIGMLTMWMLEQAIVTLKNWQDKYPGQTIAVNVSTHDLRDTSFPDQIAALLRQYDLNPKLLKLEITESGIMEDPGSTIELLNRLRAIGLDLSIDDFGTGYSSLSYLQRLPVSELKIDRSFVTDIDKLPATQGLVKAIIEMGHGLGLSVIAEGIETAAERESLRQLGCDSMQGYFASKPLYGEPLQKWLASLSTH